MPNIFDEYFKNDDDEEKTPSQQAAEQVKSEANIFDEYFTQETQVKQQPVQEKPPVEEKKPFISKAVEAVKGFFFGDKETAPVPDERIQESALTVNQQARGSLESTKQEVISYLKDSVSQSSKYREFVSSLDVDNFDDNKRKIQRIVSLPGEFEVTGVQEVGKGIFKHDIETSKYESRKGTDLFNKIKTIEDTIQHTDEATGAISANRGLFKQLYEGIKDFDYVFPSSYTNYQESLDKKHLEAYEKVKNNEEITDDDLVYLNSIRANVFNELTEKGYGTLAADVITGSLSFGAEMTLMKSLAPSVSLGASPALNAIKSDKVRAVVEKIVGNSVQLAVNSQFDIPTIDQKTAQYMLPTVDYEEWVSDTEKKDILETLKDGDDKNTAEYKARATTLIEYVSEGIGDYIDDALPFVKKAFIGKFLKNRGIKEAGKATAVLKGMHINGIVGEVIEEEIGEPFLANIEERDYQDPFTTPEGRERLLVEVLGIGALQGMSKVSDATIRGISGFRSSKKTSPLSIPVEQAPAVTPPEDIAIVEGGTQIIEEEQKPEEIEEVKLDPKKESVDNLIERVRDSTQAKGKLTPETIADLKQTQLGVDELQFDEGDTITLYRKGGVTEGEPAGFSVKPLEDQTPYTINKEDVLVNVQSEALKNYIQGTYTEEGGQFDKEGVRQLIEQFQEIESEVVVLANEDIVNQYSAETKAVEPVVEPEIQVEEAPKAKDKFPTYDTKQPTADVSKIATKDLVSGLVEQGGHPNQRWEPDLKLDPTGKSRYTSSDRSAYTNEITKRGVDTVLADLGYSTDRKTVWRNRHTGTEKTLGELLSVDKAGKARGRTEDNEIPFVLENWMPAEGENAIKKAYDKRTIEMKEQLEATEKAVKKAKKITKTAQKKVKSEELVAFANRYYGDVITIQKPVSGLWESKGNVVFVKEVDHRIGFIDKLKQDNFIEDAQEAGGNNVIKLTFKKDMIPDLVKVGKPKTKEITKTVATHEADVVKIYKANSSAVEQAMSEVFAELEIAEAGTRLFTEEGVIGVPSSFPAWIPEEYRSKKLFGKVMDGLSLDNLKYPEGNRPKQRALFDALLDEVDSRAKIDTASIRADIIEAYGKEKKEPKSTVSKRPKRSETEPTKTEVEKPYKEQPIKGTGGAYATFGEYADLETIRENMSEVPRVRFPEIVRLAKELTKSVPSVKVPRMMGLGVPNGVFYPSGDGKIVLNPNIFKDIEQAEKTLAHEVGHLTDWFPDKTLARGNLLGRITATRNFMRHTFTDLKTEGKLDVLVREQKSLQGQRKALKNDVGDITDEAKDTIVLNRLKKVNKEIKKLRESPTLKNEVVFEELKNATQLWKPFPETLPEDSSQQLIDLHAKLVAYRYSGEELYADALSMLLNSPRLLEKTAPTFYKGFFENIDNKPEIKKQYFELWDLINSGEEAISSERQKTIRESFKKGEDIAYMQIEEKRTRDKEYTFRLKYELVDKNQRVIDKVKQAKKEGKSVPDDMNPVYWLEGHNYVGGIVKNYVEDNIQPLYKKVQAADLAWEDLGEVLFLERVVKERGDIVNPIGYLKEIAPFKYDAIKEDLPSNIESKSTTEQLKFLEKQFGEDVDLDSGMTLYQEILTLLPRGLANPFGTTSESAKQQLAHLEKQLGAEKWKVLSEVLEGFRTSTNVITKMAEDEGFYKPSLIKEIKANPAYATFQVIDYMQDFIPASIKHQVGTLKDIANPADSTVMKSISIIRAIERNKVKKNIVQFMATNFADEIQEAKYTFNGNRRTAIEPKDAKLGLLTIIDNGVVKGFYVDKYIAETMEYTSTGENNAVVEVFKLFNNKLFRPMFITFNVGFQSFNLFRDFFRFYKNIPNMSMGRALKDYAKALKPAARSAWNIPDATIKEMEQNKMFGITYNDVIKGATTADKRIDVLLAKTDVTPLKGKKRSALLKPVVAVLDLIEKTGNFIEAIPKVAGYQELSGVLPKERLAHTIRSQVGSPDFLRKGSSYKTTNEIFLFSNAIKEGIRSDIEVATDPQTRSGWWFKTAKIALLPKLIMYAALLGLFGDKLKEMLEDVSEYDKTNYTIIPLGEDANGKTLYIRIPQDETGRLIGGIFWKMLRAGSDNRPIMQNVTDLLSFTGGQLPSMNPLIASASATKTFLAGKNPYDYFKGRPVIPETEFEAGGKYALKPFINWQLQTLGLNTLVKGYTSYQSPETRTWVQKVVEAPVASNIIGRWVKVSDYGKTERNKQIVSNEEQVNAKRLLEERRKIEDAVKEYREGAQSITRRGVIERQLVKDIISDYPHSGSISAKKTNTLKKFRTAVVKGTADANVTSLIYANTNAEKLALLKEIKRDLSNEEFIKLRKTLLGEKIVSINVFKELAKE